MTREETKKILMAIVAYYPDFKRPNTDDELDMWLTAWQQMFEETPYETVMKGLQAFVKTDPTGFAPKIGQLNNIINVIQEESTGGYLNDMQAWSLVEKALRRSAWWSKEEYEKLPPLIQKAVGSADNLRNWATSEDSNMSVIMAKFQSTYAAEVKRDRLNNRMPLDIQHMIQEKQNERLQISTDE